MIRKTNFGKLENILVLEFGKGTIQVQPASGEGYECLMFKSDDENPIGTEHQTKGKNSDWFKPEVVMTFTNLESLQVVMNALETVKNEMILGLAQGEI